MAGPSQRIDHGCCRDNGSSYVAGDEAKWLDDDNIKHLAARPDVFSQGVDPLRFLRVRFTLVGVELDHRAARATSIFRPSLRSVPSKKVTRGR
jgi:hypothetical protein